jgi:peroxin-1
LTPPFVNSFLRTVSTDPPDANSAVLLSTNTEISIAPKPRSKLGASTTKQSIVPITPLNEDKVATPQSSGTTRKTELTRGSKVALRALPSNLVDHRHNGPACVLVAPATFARITKQQPPLSSKSTRCYFVTIRRLQPPFSMPSTQPENRAAATPAIGQQDKMANGLQLGGGKQPDTATRIPPSILLWSNSVPEEHIVCVDAAPGVSDWDIVS